MQGLAEGKALLLGLESLEFDPADLAPVSQSGQIDNKYSLYGVETEVPQDLPDTHLSTHSATWAPVP